MVNYYLTYRDSLEKKSARPNAKELLVGKAAGKVERFGSAPGLLYCWTRTASTREARRTCSDGAGGENETVYTSKKKQARTAPLD